MTYIYLIFQNVITLLSENIVPGVSFFWFYIALFAFAVVLRFI